MIVKGIIETIDFTDNNCRVRIPLFETAGQKNLPAVITATFMIQPGIYNGYIPSDIVYVGFENDNINKAVIVGKLYLGAKAESKNIRGIINCNKLLCNGADVSQQIKNNILHYDITELINRIGELEKKVADLESK